MANALCFAGNEFGMFVLARSILAKNPAISLKFFYRVPPSPDTNVLNENFFWDQGLNPDTKTGIMYDHHRSDIATWSASRAEFVSFPIQALAHLAQEGLSDTVEFRRLARKFIRRAKQQHCQALFFPEAIFAEPTTKKILQHLAGSQLKIVTVTAATEVLESAHQSIEIYHQLSDISFLQKRAETLLQTKLKPENFVFQATN